VTGSLVDPPGRKVGRSRAQKNESGPGVKLAMAKLFDRLRDQRERLVNPAGESVSGPEGRGDDRCHDNDLPRSAEVEAPLEVPSRTRQIPTTEVSEAEIEQPVP
jgi:hypothetical protein